MPRFKRPGALPLGLGRRFLDLAQGESLLCGCGQYRSGQRVGGVLLGGGGPDQYFFLGRYTV